MPKKEEKKKRTRIKFIPGCYVRHHQVLLLIGPLQESALQTTTSQEWRPSFVSQPIDEVCTSVVAMATSSRKYSVPALHLCVCGAVLLCLLTADVTAALHKEPEVVASTEAFYLRGNPSVKAESEESYESFERRELAEYNDSSANCSANCDVP